MSTCTRCNGTKRVQGYFFWQDCPECVTKPESETAASSMTAPADELPQPRTAAGALPKTTDDDDEIGCARCFLGMTIVNGMPADCPYCRPTIPSPPPNPNVPLAASTPPAPAALQPRLRVRHPKPLWQRRLAAQRNGQKP